MSYSQLSGCLKYPLFCLPTACVQVFLNLSTLGTMVCCTEEAKESLAYNKLFLFSDAFMKHKGKPGLLAELQPPAN